MYKVIGMPLMQLFIVVFVVIATFAVPSISSNPSEWQHVEPSDSNARRGLFEDPTMFGEQGSSSHCFDPNYRPDSLTTSMTQPNHFESTDIPQGFSMMRLPCTDDSESVDDFDLLEMNDSSIEPEDEEDKVFASSSKGKSTGILGRTNRSPAWYKHRPLHEKEKVISLMSQHWYGSNDRSNRKVTCKHITKKFTSDEFDQVLYSKGDVPILEKVTENASKRFGCRNRASWAKETVSNTGRSNDIDWYKNVGTTHEKMLVIKKMCSRWYPCNDKNNRAMTAYRIQHYFTDQDFLDVLHSDANKDQGAILDSVARRVEADVNMHKFDNASAHDENEEKKKPSTWYQAMDRSEDKRYVITRMAYMWYKQIDDRDYREKARKNIIKKFTPEDFELVANPNTPDEILLEISARTLPLNQHQLDILAMKNDIVKQGIMRPTTVSKYVKEAVESFGFAERPIEELREHVINRWKTRRHHRGSE